MDDKDETTPCTMEDKKMLVEVFSVFSGDRLASVQIEKDDLVYNLVKIIRKASRIKIDFEILLFTDILDAIHPSLTIKNAGITNEVFLTVKKFQKLLLTTDLHGGVQIWNATTGTTVTSLEGYGAVTCVAISPDTLFIATGMLNDTVRIWNTVSGDELSLPHKTRVKNVNFSPNSMLLVTVCLNPDCTARVWEVVSGKLLYFLKHPKPALVSAEFSPDSKLLVTGSNHSARLWKLPPSLPYSKKVKFNEVYHGERVFSTSFSSDGSFLLTLSQTNNRAKVWSVTTLSCFLVLTATENAIFSPNGTMVAAYKNLDASIWDLKQIKCLLVAREYPFPISKVAFSTDERQVITCTWHRSVVIWNLKNGFRTTVLYPINMLWSWTLLTCFDDDANYLAISTDKAEEINIWNVKEGYFMTTIVHTIPLKSVKLIG